MVPLKLANTRFDVSGMSDLRISGNYSNYSDIKVR